MTGSRRKSGYYWVGNWNQNAVVAIENQTTSAIVRHYIKSIESDPIDPDPIDPLITQLINALLRRFAGEVKM